MLRFWSPFELVLIIFCLVVGCSAEPMRQGQFACEDRSDCPPGWYCDRDGTCYSEGNADDDTGTDTGSDTGTDGGSGTDTDTGSDTGTDSGSGTGTDTGSDTGTDGGSGTDTDTGSDTGTDSGSGTGSDTDSDSDTNGDSNPVHYVLCGTLDAEGNATIAVPEIKFDDMPVVMGYVFSKVHAEPGYVTLGNIIPREGIFRFAAGAGNAYAKYLLVVFKGVNHTIVRGTLDAEGNSTIAVPEVVFDDMPVVIGYVFSEVYAEPGYVKVGNIIPSEGTFRFAAGTGNANAQYLLVTTKGLNHLVVDGILNAFGNATIDVPEIKFDDMPLIVGYVFSDAYVEPGFVQLGNIVPSEGTFRFAAGSSNAEAKYSLVLGR